MVTLHHFFQTALVAMNRREALHHGFPIAAPGEEIRQIAQKASDGGNDHDQSEMKIALRCCKTACKQYCFSFEKAAYGNSKIAKFLYEVGNIHLYILLEILGLNA